VTGFRPNSNHNTPLPVTTTSIIVVSHLDRLSQTLQMSGAMLVLKVWAGKALFASVGKYYYPARSMW